MTLKTESSSKKNEISQSSNNMDTIPISKGSGKKNKLRKRFVEITVDADPLNSKTVTSVVSDSETVNKTVEKESSIKQRKRKLSELKEKTDKSEVNRNSLQKLSKNEAKKEKNNETLKQMNSESCEGTGLLNNTPESLKKKSKKRKRNKTILGSDSSKQLNLLCIEYINKWKNDKSNWKFEKIKQMRLISNMFDKEKLPEESFPVFMEYMAGASESMKKLLLTKANEVIAEIEKRDSLSEEEKLTTPEPDEVQYERARCIVQSHE